MNMSVVYMSFLGVGLCLIVLGLTVRETACEWQRHSGGGKINL